MPIVAFPANVLEDAKVLSSYSVEVLEQFIKLAIQNMKEGANAKTKKKYAGAAKSLKVDVSVITDSVLLICHIFLVCSKRSLNEKDFSSSCEELGLPRTHLRVLTKSYKECSADLRKQLKDNTMRLPHYSSLDWRLDVTISSRSISNNIQPSFLIQLKTEDQGQGKEHVFEMDFATLSHVCDEVDSAIKEASSKHVNRMLRYVR